MTAAIFYIVNTGFWSIMLRHHIRGYMETDVLLLQFVYM